MDFSKIFFLSYMSSTVVNWILDHSLQQIKQWNHFFKHPFLSYKSSTVEDWIENHYFYQIMNFLDQPFLSYGTSTVARTTLFHSSTFFLKNVESQPNFVPPQWTFSDKIPRTFHIEIIYLFLVALMACCQTMGPFFLGHPQHATLVPRRWKKMFFNLSRFINESISAWTQFRTRVL